MLRKKLLRFTTGFSAWPVVAPIDFFHDSTFQLFYCFLTGCRLSARCLGIVRYSAGYFKVSCDLVQPMSYGLD